MPAQPFTVHVDPDDLARQDLAAAIHRPTVDDTGDAGPAGSTTAGHHGAGDASLAARQRSEQERSSRAPRAGSGRSYVFRRS